MGSCSSSPFANNSNKQYVWCEKKKITKQAVVEHFMPAEFPLVDSITSKDIRRCSDSWEILKSQDLTVLMDEFYYRLFLRAERFRAIFKTIKKKATVLTKSIMFILSVNKLTEQEQKQHYQRISLVHRKMGLSAWMFGVYLSVLLETISFNLAGYNSIELMESWTKLCSYTLRNLLTDFVVSQKINFNSMNFNYQTVRKTPTESEMLSSPKNCSDRPTSRSGRKRLTVDIPTRPETELTPFADREFFVIPENSESSYFSTVESSPSSQRKPGAKTPKRIIVSPMNYKKQKISF